ncbi:hypothetical protein ACFQE1_00270 [Halobium palmae]|uniref:DUF7344 domain-containing protein n=1 Tax=Halobium palmae TaxID=1776492 RepID=A0ABD5RUQ8_9EURY
MTTLPNWMDYLIALTLFLTRVLVRGFFTSLCVGLYDTVGITQFKIHQPHTLKPPMTEKSPSETSMLARLVKQFTNSSTDDYPTNQPTTEELPITETLKILVRKRRRVILEELNASNETPLPVASLAERVACVEYQCDIETLTNEQRRRVYIALQQSHLPTLAAADVIVYETDANTVDRGKEFDRIWQTYSAIIESLS